MSTAKHDTRFITVTFEAIAHEGASSVPISLNGELAHEQRVVVLRRHIREWYNAESGKDAYRYLAESGAFDAETNDRLLQLRECPSVPLNKLPTDLEPLAQALKSAFRTLCSA